MNQQRANYNADDEHSSVQQMYVYDSDYLLWEKTELIHLVLVGLMAERKADWQIKTL